MPNEVLQLVDQLIAKQIDQKDHSDHNSRNSKKAKDAKNGKDSKKPSSVPISDGIVVFLVQKLRELWGFESPGCLTVSFCHGILQKVAKHVNIYSGDAHFLAAFQQVDELAKLKCPPMR